MTFRTFVLLALVGTALQPMELRGQDGTDVELTPFVGRTLFLNDPPPRFGLEEPSEDALVLENSDFEDAVAFGLAAGVRLGERYTVEAVVARTSTTLRALSGTQDAVETESFLYALTLLVGFPREGRLDPYAGAGLGGATLSYDAPDADDQSKLAGVFVAGTRVALTGDVALRFDARTHVSSLESRVAGMDDELQVDLLLSVGLSIQLSTEPPDRDP